VTADSNKKKLSLLRSGCIHNVSSSLALPPQRTGDQAGSIGQFAIDDDYRAGFGFMQENVEKF
jgi:hypothetical protein